MQVLFDLFLKEKLYLCNLSPKTIESYKQAFNSYKRVLGGERIGSSKAEDLPTKHALTEFVIGLRQTMSAGGANVYIRSMNSFLSWLYENEHTSEHLRIKPLKVETKIRKSFDFAHLQAIVRFKAQSFTQHRIHALLCLLIDTGVRIDEALTLKTSAVDFDNCLVTVRGKGNKERIIPFSFELRKVLFKFIRRHNQKFLFPVRDGGHLEYHNARRDFLRLMSKLGIKGFDGAFHASRRLFARNYLRRGGNLFYLKTVMGHTDIKTTEKYLDVQTEALQEVHSRVSVLENIH